MSSRGQPEEKPKPRQPYTQAEIIRILATCDIFGKYSYERLRARAMILLMRFYGLRISDVATFRRDHIKNDHIFLHAVGDSIESTFEIDEGFASLPRPVTGRYPSAS